MIWLMMAFTVYILSGKLFKQCDVIAFIKREEGFSPNKFWDHAQYTIGYGTKYDEGDPDPMTTQQADAKLRSVMSSYINAARANWNRRAAEYGLRQWDDLRPCERAGIISFVYNNGAGAISTSEFVKYYKSDPEKSKGYFIQWNKASGVVLKGLVRRRFREWHYIKTGTVLNNNADADAYYNTIT